MFDDFLEDIGEVYNSVDDFFKDITGGEGVIDIAKAGVGAFYGTEGGSSGGGSSSSGSTPDYVNSKDFDSVDLPSGAMSDLDRAVGDSQAIKSVDGEDILNDWYSKLYTLATGDEWRGLSTNE